MDFYTKTSIATSKEITKAYSPSFSRGILGLSKPLRSPIYANYGFVRVADEIVDTFHGKNQRDLLERFWSETDRAIDEGISTNPVLQSFQYVVNEYQIDRSLINTFLRSMEMDLKDQNFDQATYEQYILGSAEVVGLMCLKVFVQGDQARYEELTPFAMKLGSAFQKINFLRDVAQDFQSLGRSYFPNVDLSNFNDEAKMAIERDIERDFRKGYEGILQLPKGSRFGVYIAYMYYYALFQKIMRTPSSEVFMTRIRIGNRKKYRLFASSFVRHMLNLL